MLLLIQVHENTLIFGSYTRNKDLKTKRDFIRIFTCVYWVEWVGGVVKVQKTTNVYFLNNSIIIFSKLATMPAKQKREIFKILSDA